MADPNIDGLINTRRGDMLVFAVDVLGAAQLHAEHPAAKEAIDWYDRVERWAGLPDSVPEVRTDGDRFDSWVRSGTSLAATGGEIAAQLAADNASEQLKRFAFGFPGAAKAAGAALVRGVKGAVNEVVDAAADALEHAADKARGVTWKAALAVVVPVVAIGAALAAVAFLLTRSGVRAHAGPVALG